MQSEAPSTWMSLSQLNQRQLRGVEHPITSTTWPQYAEDLEQFAAGAGGIKDTAMANHLRMTLYTFQDTVLRLSVLTAAAGIADPLDLSNAVSAAIDTHCLTLDLTAQQHHGGVMQPGQATLMVNPGNPDDATPVLYGQRRPDPPKHFHDPATAQRPLPHAADRNQADTRWNASEHGPCRNWIRGRDRCDGRHHLNQCPLPQEYQRPVGSVFSDDTTTPESTPALTTALADPEPV